MSVAVTTVTGNHVLNFCDVFFRSALRIGARNDVIEVLAVPRVTENTGKKTPGVDKEIWDTPEKKNQAVQALKRRGYQPQPLRRVYIPKSDGKTMRPLGIPTMKDRAQQPLYLLALDPVVETTADKNSYGSLLMVFFNGPEDRHNTK